MKFQEGERQLAKFRYALSFFLGENHTRQNVTDMKFASARSMRARRSTFSMRACSSLLEARHLALEAARRSTFWRSL